MTKLHFEIDINAPVQKVWEKVIGEESYRTWTAPFCEGVSEGGSYYEGSWDEGATLHFLALGKDGKPSGMVSTVAESRPYKFLSLRHLGEVVAGVDDTSSDRVKAWSGKAYENYTFTEKEGVTNFSVDVDMVFPEYTEYMSGAWKKSLEILKSISEQA